METRAPTTPTSQGPVTATAAEQAKRVGSTATDAASDVASTAVDQAARVADEAKRQVRNVVDEGTHQLHTQARTQTDQIATKLGEIGHRIEALADGRVDEAGPVGDYARQVAGTVNRYASRIQDRGFDGVVDDVQRFARRRPGAFLLGATALGFGVGRLLRSSAAASKETRPSGPPPLNDVGGGTGDVTMFPSGETTGELPLAAPRRAMLTGEER